MKVISFDVEVFYSSKLKYGLRNMLVDQFVKHELFDVYQIAVSDGTQSWAGAIKDFNWTSLEGAHVVSHNARFDETCYLELVERGLAPRLNIPKWSCTADLTSYLANRRALSHAVEYFYGVKLSKAARDDSNGRHFPADFTPAQQEEMRAYGRSDALWCYRLWAEHSHKWPESEQRLSLMTRLQGRRGVQINTELLDTYIVQSHSMKLATEKLLPWLRDVEEEDDSSWEGFATKPTSVKCIAEACRRAGIPGPPVKSHYDNGEELYDEWENTYKKNTPWISALSSWRTVNRLYKTFLTAKSRLRPDGTMPFALKYFGAATGRWSGDAGLNLQNLKKRPVYATQEGIMETDETRTPGDWVKYELDFRRLIIPRLGTLLAVSDLAQVEARVAAHIVGDADLLDLVRQGFSIYEAHARATMSWAGGELKKENPSLYSLAKARILGLSFGCAWERFINMAKTLTGLDITENDPEFLDEEKTISGYGQHSKETVADYRSKNSKIVETWAKLDLALRRSIADDLRVVLQSKRVLRYEMVKAARILKLDKTTGKPKLSTVITADIGGRRFETWGSKIFENLVQATARDIFAEGLLRIEDAGHKVLFHAHDEAIVQCAPETKPEEIEKLMTICPEWCKGLPLGAEARIVPYYCK